MDAQHPALPADTRTGPGRPLGELLAETLAQHGAARYADVDALLPYLDTAPGREAAEDRDGAS